MSQAADTLVDKGVIRSAFMYKIFIVEGNEDDKKYITDFTNLLNSFEQIKTLSQIANKDSDNFHRTIERLFNDYQNSFKI